MKVLIVDDDQMLRFLTANVVKRMGQFDIYELSDGIEILSQCIKIQPDLILLDVIMPGLNGLQCLSELKAHSATAEIPVIFLTAKNKPEDLVELKNAGASGIVVKPFHPDALKQEILRVVARNWK